jgi:hypothetical protein
MVPEADEEATSDAVEGAGIAPEEEDFFMAMAMRVLMVLAKLAWLWQTKKYLLITAVMKVRVVTIVISKQMERMWLQLEIGELCS